MSVETLFMLLVGVAVAALGYLLAKKDEAQERQMKQDRETAEKQWGALWEAHNRDASRLTELELHVAKNHYPKIELDQKMFELQKTLQTGQIQIQDELRSLTVEVRSMVQAFAKHAASEDAREQTRLEIEQQRARRGRSSD